ncbi:serine carboxypeptidase-like [Prosopis cineraria]|uniref:serine carboxypeptidase-like n=1 Tax=Prosopis cineraria TaxID=364024 RepID=UPI00240F1AA7|nr:serine carboxypeptidase-like [Prosopis cineraria]
MASPSSDLVQIFLSFLLFVFLSPSYFAASSGSKYIEQEGEKLIRELNLSPLKHYSYSVSRDCHSVPAGKIVEKKFRFPNLYALGGPSVQDLGHHAGYYGLPHSHGEKMFYLFFESRNSKKDPVVIWLTGGPGCGSELALFYENGPFHITDDLSLVWNDYGWDKVSNILYIDQPIGTGFSHVSDQSDIRHDEEGVSNDLYDFLQAFFKEHPEFVENDFYITGESYAGHYIPALASRIHQANKAKEGIHINLKGFAIGNGETKPVTQYGAYTDFAYENNIIDGDTYNRIGKMVGPCLGLIIDCNKNGGDVCESAFYNCNENVFGEILKAADNINYYDIRKKCDQGPMCYDFSNMETFLNKKEVKNALGVGEMKYITCSVTVYAGMKNDWMRSMEGAIPALLEDGIRMLVYAGDKDLICNWLGNARWVEAMEWSGQDAFLKSPNVSFVVDGKEAGRLLSHEPLSFLKILEAGHMVPMDQPKVALEMLTRWMQGKLTMT